MSNFSLRKVATVSLSLFVFSCRDSSVENPVESEAFQYWAYDSTGVPVVTGWFTMNYPDSSTILGDWHFSPVDYPKNIGPQTGEGRLQGAHQNGQIFLDLNPQFRDNNVVLVGALDKHRFSGQWTWLTFVGVTNKGRFEAVTMEWVQMW